MGKFFSKLWVYIKAAATNQSVQNIVLGIVLKKLAANNAVIDKFSQITGVTPDELTKQAVAAAKK